MGVPTYLDAVVIGIPFVLGLFGIRWGLRRSLVSWPVRWSVALIGAAMARASAAAYLILNRDLAAQLNALSPMVIPGVRLALAFLAFVVLLLILGRIRNRVLDRIGDSFIGSVERIFGGAFGTAFGLLLVTWLIVIPYMFYESMRPDQNSHPAWIRESLSLPYIKDAGEALKGSVLPYLPPSNR